MNITVEQYFMSKEFNNDEKEIINDIFSIVPSNVYFYINFSFNIDEKNIYNFYGMSGDGKTVIKEKIKEIVGDCADFDDLDETIFYDKTIKEIFNITTSNDEILKLLSYFGLFEIRIIFANYGQLSNGQKTRIKYVYLFYLSLKENKKYILIDEFLTFVDSISAINFSTGISKFLKNKDIKLFTFGVNDTIITQFEDITYGIVNGKCNFIVEKKNDVYEIEYVSKKDSIDSNYFKENMKRNLIEKKNIKSNLNTFF